MIGVAIAFDFGFAMLTNKIFNCAFKLGAHIKIIAYKLEEQVVASQATSCSCWLNGLLAVPPCNRKAAGGVQAVGRNWCAAISSSTALTASFGQSPISP